ncbi:MAG: PP2C family protein-serine/threonine phosphatase, partial [Spirochaetota bacterium]
FTYRPIFNVGGDFVDFITSSPQGLGVFICDVSGHGVAAALLASMIKMALNGWELFLRQPAALLNDVRCALCGKMGNHFVTASACFIDFETGEIIASRAGHPPALLLHADGRVEEISPRGKLISEKILPECETYHGTLLSGDKLVLYTDGLIESRSREGIFLGVDRFIDILRAHAEIPAQSMCSNVIDEVIRYADGNIEDDITLVVIEYRA